MSGTSNWKHKLETYWQKQVERSAEHPIRASLPFLAATVLILGAVITADSLTVCYTAATEGQPLVFFQGEETYGKAVVEAENRASRILDTDYSFDEDVTIRTVVAPKDKVEDLPQVTDSIMELIPELEHVYTLSIDGELVGAATDADVLREAISLVEDAYTTPETRSVSIENQISLHYEYLPADQGVTDAQALADLLMEESVQTFSYTIQPGDTLESVTENFGMTEDRLAELNPDVAYLAQTDDAEDEADSQDEETARQTLTTDDEDVLSQSEVDQLMQELTGTPLEEGAEITVEALSPRLVVTTVEEQTLSREITPERQDQADDSMYVGEERIIQEGAVGEATVLARVVTRAGTPIASTDLSSVTVTEATPMIIGVGTQEKPQLANGCLFLWPVQGRISSDFGYRFIFGENNFHRGVDIATSYGTAISAAMDGTVVFSGEKGSYGNLVILSHSNGFYTYYGHCSQLLVSVGQQVSQGDVIAAVGSTGRSTGPHCHFEVRYQGSPIDPLLYLPGSNNAPVRTVTPSSLLTPVETETTTTNNSSASTSTTTTTPAASTTTETTGITTTTPVTPTTPETGTDDTWLPEEDEDSGDLGDLSQPDGSEPSAQALEDSELTVQSLDEEVPLSAAPETTADISAESDPSQPQDPAEAPEPAQEPVQEPEL